MAILLYFGIYLIICFGFYKWAEWRLVIPKWCEYIMLLNIFFWIVAIGNAVVLNGANNLKYTVMKKL